MVLSSRTMAWAVALLLAGSQARAQEADAAIPEFPQSAPAASAARTPGVQIQSRRRARPDSATVAPAAAAAPALVRPAAAEPIATSAPSAPVIQQTSAVSPAPRTASHVQGSYAPAPVGAVRAPVYGASGPTVATPASNATLKAQAPCPTCPGGVAAAPSRHVDHGRHGGSHGGGSGAPGPVERLKFKYNNYWKPSLQERFWGYPEEFGEKPLGYFLYAHARTQTANAEASRMVLYSYDFEERSDALTPRGQLQLGKIAYMAPQNFFPIIIENTPAEPELAEKRRMKVLEILQASNAPVPAERVVVSRPIAAGMRSFEVAPVQSNFDGILDAGGIVDPATEIRQEIQQVGQ